MTAPTKWVTGAAEIVSVRNQFVIVDCCHCQSRHAHTSKSVGSREMVAGCSTPSQPRTYAILPNKGNR